MVKTMMRLYHTTVLDSFMPLPSTPFTHHHSRSLLYPETPSSDLEMVWDAGEMCVGDDSKIRDYPQPQFLMSLSLTYLFFGPAKWRRKSVRWLWSCSSKAVTLTIIHHMPWSTILSLSRRTMRCLRRTKWWARQTTMIISPRAIQHEFPSDPLMPHPHRPKTFRCIVVAWTWRW